MHDGIKKIMKIKQTKTSSAIKILIEWALNNIGDWTFYDILKAFQRQINLENMMDMNERATST